VRVLHVVRGLANSSGTTHIVVPLAEEQARQGAKVSVYYVAKGREAPVLPDPALVESHCFAQSLPGSNPGFSFSFARAMRANACSFDVVHVHAVWNFCTYWTMRAAYEAHVPYVVAPQGSFEPWALAQSAMKKRLLGPLTEVPLFNRAAALQALTETEAVQFRRYGLTAPAVIVPNGVDPAKFDRCAPPLARQLGLTPGMATLLFMSRVHPKKGLDLLLAAFALIAAALPRLTLIVAGNDGGSGYAAELKRLAVSLGIGERCRFVGEVRGEAKLDMLAGADAFVLPSHSEGLPVAAIEAMAAALPVILSPGCNLPEVASAGAGLIVEPSPEILSCAIGRMFADPDAARAMGESGRRLVASSFTWQRIASETLEIYRNLKEPRVARSA
jgi:glycosyltransferase involved in cell wall biosynthesis